MKKTFLATAALLGLAALAPLPLAAEDPAPAPAAPAKPYPLDTCIVSDEKIGSMGAGYTFVHEGQEIKMCCEYCKPKFEKDPATYLKKLEK